MATVSNSQYRDREGFVTLLAVLIVTALGSAVAFSLVLLGLGSSRTSFALEQSNRAKALANACAEAGLQQIRASRNFSGTLTIPLGGGSCTYTVQRLSGDNRIVDVSGSVGTVIRKIKITLDQIRPVIHLTSWQEVADL